MKAEPGSSIRRSLLRVARIIISSPAVLLPGLHLIIACVKSQRVVSTTPVPLSHTVYLLPLRLSTTVSVPLPPPGAGRMYAPSFARAPLRTSCCGSCKYTESAAAVSCRLKISRREWGRELASAIVKISPPVNFQQADGKLKIIKTQLF